MAYLMDTYADGTFKEADAMKWAEGIEFAIVHELKDDERIWKVVKRNADNVQAGKQVPVKEGKH